MTLLDGNVIFLELIMLVIEVQVQVFLAILYKQLVFM